MRDDNYRPGLTRYERPRSDFARAFSFTLGYFAARVAITAAAAAAILTVILIFN